MNKNYFVYDVFRKLGKKKMNLFDKINNRDLKCLKVFRHAQKHQQSKNKILKIYYMLKLKKLCNKYDFNVPASTKIGKGLFIGHNGPIIINKDAIIGDNCNIATGVTIGVENRGSRIGCPTIGNKVWIGTNAVIVGKVNIGDNVLIAPNSFVNFSVPDNSIVLGNPAKIIPSANATKGYITNTIEELL